MEYHTWTFSSDANHETRKSMSKLIPVVLRSISYEQIRRQFFTEIKCHVKWVHGTSPTCFLIKNGWYYSNGTAAASYMILPSTVLISLVCRTFRSAMLPFGKRELYISISSFLRTPRLLLNKRNLIGLGLYIFSKLFSRGEAVFSGLASCAREWQMMIHWNVILNIFRHSLRFYFNQHLFSARRM